MLLQEHYHTLIQAEIEDYTGNTLTRAESSDSTTENPNTDTTYWYPVWGGTNKCSNAPGMPKYMRKNSDYVTSCKWHSSICVLQNIYY